MESFENVEISPPKNTSNERLQKFHLTEQIILKVEETCLYVLQDLKHIQFTYLD